MSSPPFPSQRKGDGVFVELLQDADTSAGSDLTFRPLYPRLETQLYIIWKKYPVFSPIAERFLRKLQERFA